jgi:hypothetical protein
MKTNLPHAPEEVIQSVITWLERAVIGLNLCPFAKVVHVRHQIRYVVSTATEPAELADDLMRELKHLHAATPDETDTTLLIHPWVLNDFLEYNEFLDVADVVLAGAGLEGEIQIASFHPDYQFANTHRDDVSNYTNRSPHPILHLLREASIDKAVEAFPNASKIYEKNIATLRRLGKKGWQNLLAGEQNSDE